MNKVLKPSFSEYLLAIVLILIIGIPILTIGMSIANGIENGIEHPTVVSPSLAIPSDGRLVMVGSNGNERVIYENGCYVTQQVNFARTGWEDLSGAAYQCGVNASPSLLSR